MIRINVKKKICCFKVTTYVFKYMVLGLKPSETAYNIFNRIDKNIRGYKIIYQYVCQNSLVIKAEKCDRFVYSKRRKYYQLWFIMFPNNL
jgi:hypothetical protein